MASWRTALRTRLEKRDTPRVRHRHRGGRPPDRGVAPRAGRRPPRRGARAAVAQLEGAYSLVVCALDDPEVLVGAKVPSPLVVGVGDGETLLASTSPLLDRTTTVIPLEEGMIVEVRSDGATFTDLEGRPMSPEAITVDWDVPQARKGGYDTFMRKEIDEQPAAIRDTLVGRTVGDRLALDELRVSDDVLREAGKVFVVARAERRSTRAWSRSTRSSTGRACRSRSRSRASSATATLQLGPDTLTLTSRGPGRRSTRWRPRARGAAGSVIAVTNTVGSSLAREADGAFYTHAGPEIGVAATKTFATEMVSQYLGRCTSRRSSARCSPRRSPR